MTMHEFAIAAQEKAKKEQHDFLVNYGFDECQIKVLQRGRKLKTGHGVYRIDKKTGLLKLIRNYEQNEVVVNR